jgi:hypothetical protein
LDFLEGVGKAAQGAEQHVSGNAGKRFDVEGI